MDGNFIDNSIESLIESAGVAPLEHVDDATGQAPTKLSNKYDAFTLRIKFNRALDPHSVNAENAVMVTENRPVKASVHYDKERKSIIIKPKSKYLRNKLYVLKISGKLMTEKGRSLRKHLFFAFRQNGGNLSFYRGMVGEVGTAPKKLPIQRSYIIPLLFTISAVILVLSYLYYNNLGLIVGTIIVLIAVIFAMLDSVSDYGKSHKEYIYGAKLYNQGFFYEALECFERAMHHNPENKYAKYALEAAIIKSLKGG